MHDRRYNDLMPDDYGPAIEVSGSLERATDSPMHTPRLKVRNES